MQKIEDKSMKYSLGIDMGSSSIKLSLMDILSGECVASATNPSSEMKIEALEPGWAEQDPDMWWEYISMGLKQIAKSHSLKDVVSIGITYQMHGMVALIASMNPCVGLLYGATREPLRLERRLSIV